MSFGGGGFGSSGFGQNNQNTSTGFGGFGSNTNTSSGFGTNQNTGGFGAGTTGAAIFGGSGGGFGSNTTSNAFGQNKTSGFGSTGTGGGIFGNTSSNTTSAFGSGGFGSAATTNNNNTTSAFGGGNTSTGGGGIFGSSKPSGGFGSTGGTNLFGSNTTNAANTGSSFGSSSTGGGLFGQQAASAFTNVAESQGTAGQTFQPYQEKETNSAITNHFQSISFMQPFQKHSFEELRLADYNRGNKQGNANGQAGSFGASTGFGGFGSNNNNNNNTTASTGFGTGTPGLFGGNAATTSASSFGGANTATSGGFGTGTGTGGLFGGQNKTGGLFGSNQTNTNTGATSAGVFGTQGTTGFGQQNNQSGGLFGGNSQQNQQKPGGLFGGTTGNTGFGSGTTGFGNTSTNTNSGLFGNNQQQQPQAQQQNTGFGGTQQNTNPFGQPNNAASNPFGQNQQKPAGLFGNQQTGQTGGLFGGGANTQQNATGQLFANTNQPASQTGSIFGNNQNKGAFGNLGGGGGGLFGGNQQQTNQAGSMFGNNQQAQQQNAGGIFGNNQQQNTAGGLFGNNQQNQNTNSVFGSTGAQNALNNQQPQQNVLQAPSGFQASLGDPSPYGSASIFHGLPPPPQNSPGPIATPIAAGSIRAKKPAALPQYKLNPAVASRLMTPQKRGYGFSYSTYGTPSSTTSTPGGLGSSLMGGSLGRSLGKSLSTSNLRSDGEPTSILAPGAFSASSQRYSATGSLKRLTIDRNLRTDLFSSSQPVAALPPATTKPAEEPRLGSALKKKVSFDTTAQAEANEQAIERQSATPTAQEQGYLRSSTLANGSKPTQSNGDADESVVQGNELAIVPEDNSPEATRAKPTNLFDQGDPQPGDYWIEPSLDELKKMPKSELKAVRNFKIGRENCGFVEFNEPVDLLTVDIEHIPEQIAVITLRSLTIYPENAHKPTIGKGLNVPATITLENSWPRARDRRSPSYEKSGPRFNKHVERLKRVPDTEYVDYNKDTGEWTFRVPHFTTYGLEYDDDDESMATDQDLNQSVLKEAPPTPTPQGMKVRGPPKPASEQHSSSAISPINNEVMNVDSDEGAASLPGDDTFGYRRPRTVPGGFDDGISDEEYMEGHEMEMTENGMPVFASRSASPGSAASEEEPREITNLSEHVAPAVPVEMIAQQDLTMAGSFPDIGQDSDDDVSHFSASGTPKKLMPDLNDDWADRLQQTVSPRKQDRQALKQSQAFLDKGYVFVDAESTPTGRKGPKAAENEFGDIKTSVDLMRSLFGKEEMRRSGRKDAKTGFQWPYDKQSSNSDQQDMSPQDVAFHQSFKPSFGAGNRYIMRRKETQVAQRTVNVPSVEVKVVVKNNVPAAELRQLSFSEVRAMRAPTNQQEARAYELLSILFDSDTGDSLTSAIPESERPQLAHRIRKDRLSNFWAKLCEPAAMEAVKSAKTAEERAMAYLSMHKVAEACEALTAGKDYRLATLVAQIGGDEVQREVMKDQIASWLQSKTLSEFDNAVRALYSLLAGETCYCDASPGAVEDRVSGFSISKRFDFDWLRAFGLKLWYGILPEDSLETAVRMFADDLASGKEETRPDPTVLTPKLSASTWTDPNPGSRQDMVWGILSLVAEQSQPAAKSKLPAVISPENIVGSPTSYRLTFELHQMMAGRLPRAVDPIKADALTIAFSSELETLGNWRYALFVLLFIDDPKQRERAFRTALARLAPEVREGDENEIDYLFKTLRIPESWFWNAKALESRAKGQKSREAVFLARGHNWVEAHQVLCEDVAPLAIIERDHKRLAHILETFPQKQIPEWRLGGQVFSDYLALYGGKLGSPEEDVILRSLLSALAELKPRPGDRRKLTFAQSVALGEMSKLAAEKAKDMDGVEKGNRETMRLMGLPSTEEVQRQGVVDLGLQYFKAVMAQGS